MDDDAFPSAIKYQNNPKLDVVATKTKKKI